jgi:hypothetical protein
MRERTTLDAFLPRSGSAFVFVLTMACYGWAITSLLDATVGILHFPPRPPNFWASHGDPVAHVIEALLFAPLLESCILIGAVELLRWLRSPGWLQVLFATVVVAGPHSFEWAPYAFVVAPGFAIQAASYLYCERYHECTALPSWYVFTRYIILFPRCRPLRMQPARPNQTMQPTYCFASHHENTFAIFHSRFRQPRLILFSLAPHQLWLKISEEKLDLKTRPRYSRRRWFSAVKAEMSMVDLIPAR